MRAARFLVLTAACLALLDVALRRYTVKTYFWDDVAHSPGTINVLFIGTSRTAAAIDAGTFRAALPGPEIVVNAGAGFVPPVEFLFALRNTLNERPGTLRDTTLLIEAPEGVPDFQTWSDSWANPDRRDLLTPLLRVRDIPRFWRTGHALEDELALTAAYVLRPSTIVSHREDIADRIFGRVRSLIESPLDAMLVAPPPPAPDADLTAAGGIRADAEGIRLGRRTAIEYARVSTADQRPIDWPRTVMSDLVALAQSHHFRVFFFTPPLHSLHRGIYETPRRRLDRDGFFAFAAARQTPILQPVFVTTDDDFPDIWHVRKTLAPPYTRALAQSFLDVIARRSP